MSVDVRPYDHFRTLCGFLLVIVLAGCAAADQGAEIVILRDSATVDKTASAIASNRVYQSEISAQKQILAGSYSEEIMDAARAELAALQTVSADLSRLDEFALLSAGVY